MMRGDFSRQTFDRTRHYAAVLMQQGRVELDADWNEQQDLNQYLTHVEGTDAIGPCGAPNYAPGFAITPDATRQGIVIGKGRYYVDGFLLENEQDVAYAQQPDLIEPESLGTLLDRGKTNTALVYLDVWQRLITVLDDPHIRERALGGPDTATRLKTVWQVKFLPVQTSPTEQTRLAAGLRRLDASLGQYRDRISQTSPEEAERLRSLQARLSPAVPAAAAELPAHTAHAVRRMLSEMRAELNRIDRLTQVSAAGPLRDLDRLGAQLAQTVDLANCHSNFAEWLDLTAEPAEALRPGLDTPTPTAGPCVLPPENGFRGLENQLYRVEIHRGGVLTNPPAADGPTFKWSRDNASVAFGVQRISGKDVTVASLGLDDNTRLARDQWVEVSDDRLDLASQPGQLVQVDSTRPASLTVTMQAAVTPLTSDPDGVALARHPKLRRWDQSGDANGVAIGVDPVALENGLTVQFSPGEYTSGDYWLIPARTDGTLDWPPFDPSVTALGAEPPAGVEHHYCRLGLVERDANGRLTVHDCRRIFAPLAAPAMRITGTNWLNDAAFGVRQFRDQGLLIWFDADPFAQSLSASSVIVQAEIPFAVQRDAGMMTFPAQLPIILNGAISVIGNSLQWLPDLDQLRTVLREFNVTSLEDVRFRVTLKGHVIHWDQGTPIIHLDGQAFGQAQPPPSGSLEPRTALVFPTGSGARASDFESWFWLVDDTYAYGYGYGGSDAIGGHLL